LTITPPFVLTASSALSGQTQFSFQSLAGEAYDIQYSYQLAPPDWQPLQHIANAAGGLLTVSNPPSASQCFIRVVWIRNP
jgi:hypothetical protein